MGTEISLADVGFDATATSPLSAEQTSAVAAALDAPGHWAAGQLLPLPWHWAHFNPRTSTADLGPDGHSPVPSHVHERYPRRMWASGSIEVHAGLVIGESADRTSAIAECKQSEGRSGPLMIVTVEHTYRQAGAVRLVEQQTIVYRSQGDAVALPEGDHVPEPQPGQWVEVRRPSPIELFRFSAITFNSHRIHYDERYARATEGYPALVVHGPLTATRVVASIEREAGRPLQSFRFRAVAPLFVGLPHTIVGSIDANEVEVAVVRNDGSTAMEASGRLRTA